MSFAEGFTAPPRARAPRRKAGPGLRVSEAAIQRSIIQALRLHGVLVHHSPNEGKRTASAGFRMKQDGTRPGWPDLEAFARGKSVFIEVKAADGRLSANQVECHADLVRVGHPVWIAYSIEDALEACRVRGLIG